MKIENLNYKLSSHGRLWLNEDIVEYHQKKLLTAHPDISSHLSLDVSENIRLSYVFSEKHLFCCT